MLNCVLVIPSLHTDTYGFLHLLLMQPLQPLLSGPVSSIQDGTILDL